MAVEVSQQVPTVGAEEVFPWLKYLDEEDRQIFYAELFATLNQSLQSGNWQLLQELIEDWQATAMVLADEELTTILNKSLDEGDWEPWEDVHARILHRDGKESGEGP